MATYYWGGGSGVWSTTAVTNWYTDVGRTTLATVAPGVNDDVIFDSASSSGSYTITVNSTAPNVRNFTFSGPATGTATLAHSSTISINGNITIASTGVARTGAGSLNCFPQSITVTHNYGGLTFSSVSFQGNSSSVINLGSAISCSSLSYSNGTFNTNNYSITSQSFDSPSGIRVLNSGTSLFTLTGSGSNRWGISAAGTSNFTANFSQNSFILTALTEFNGNGHTYGSLTIGLDSSNPFSISGSSTYNNLRTTSANLTSLSFAANNTIGNFDFDGRSTVVTRKRISSTIPGTRITLNITSVSNLQNIDFMDIAITGLTLSGTNLGDLGNNSGITFNAARNLYLVGTSLDGTSYSTAASGAGQAGVYPLAQDNLIITDSAIASGGVVSGSNMTLCIKNFDMSARTLPISLFGLGQSANIVVTGDYTLSSAITSPGAPFIEFTGQNVQRIISAGRSITTSSGVVTVSKGGGKVIQNQALSIGGTLNIYSGTYDLNGYSLTCGVFATTGVVETPPKYGPRTILHGGAPIFATAASTSVVSLDGPSTTVSTPLDIFLTNTGSVGTRTLTMRSNDTTLSPSLSNINVYVLGGSDTLRLGNSRFWCGDLIISDAFTGSITAGDNRFKKLRLPANRTYTLSPSFRDANLRTCELDANGSTISVVTTDSVAGSSFNLLSSVNLTGQLSVSGSFNTNNYNFSCSSITVGGTEVRTVNLGSSTITILSNTSVLQPISITQVGGATLTFNPGTSVINIDNTGRTSGNLTIIQSFKTLNKVNIIGSGTGSMTFFTSGTINEFNVLTSVPANIVITSDTTLTVGNFTTNSTLGRRMILTSSSGTASMVKTGGGFVDLDYLDITGITVSPTNTWYAGTHSTRTGTTTNWISNYRIKPKTGNLLGFL